MNLSECADGFPPSEAPPVERRARLLPLSGKSPGAVRDLANRYLSWLDGLVGSASDTTLSDLAWTAGTGRGHFLHRAGLVFADAEQLRGRLRRVAGSFGSRDGELRDGTTRVAFVYTGRVEQWDGMGQALYRSEPVARAVLDRCDQMFGEDLGVSLLDAMSGRPGVHEGLNDPRLVRPSAYALACALTAQWASIGVRPNVVVGVGPGGPAAAQAAGVLSVEDGLRVATSMGAVQRTRRGKDHEAAVDGLEGVFAGMTLSAPSVSLINSANGRVVESVGELDATRWLRRAGEPAGASPWVRTLARLGIDVVVQVGADPKPGRAIHDVWPEAGGAPTMLPALVSPSGDGESPDSDHGFLTAVAGAYEAGLDISFAGLYAGEVRRRISLPSYPFQRRQHWV